MCVSISRSKPPIALGILLALSAACSVTQAHDSDESTGSSSTPTYGQYGLTTMQNCVRTPFSQPSTPGIDPSTRKLLVDAEPAVAVGSGLMHFFKGGRVSTSILGAELTQARLVAGQAPLSTGINYQCDGTYKALPDHGISVTFPSCTVNTGNPNTVVTVGPLELRGFLSSGSKAMNLTMVDGGIQTVAVSDAYGHVLQARQRLCVQTMSLSRQ